MTELEKMKAGLEYCFKGMGDLKEHAGDFCDRLNALSITDTEARDAAIRDLMGSVGANPTVMPVFHCDRGTNITLGDNVLINYNVSILDIGPVTIGSDVMIGPGTCISTVEHAIPAAARRGGIARMKPVRIEDNVWIGANCTILAGVTIGRNSIVAAGAVVNEDVPPDSIVGGVPARFIRKIEE